MTKRFSILAAVISSALCGCGLDVVVDPGSPVDKVFQIDGDYDAISVSNTFDVYVDADASDVTVTVGENIMKRVVVEQVGGELKIYCKPQVLSVNGDYMKAVIPQSHALKSVNVTGASSFNSSSPVSGKKVNIKLSGDSRFTGDVSGSETEMDISGASLIKGTVTSDNLNLKLSGASTANLTGQTVNLDLSISGASCNIDRIVNKHYGLECTRCKGTVSGASKAFIHCLENIDVSVSGASTLHYTGDASTSDSSASGASTIVHDTL